MQNIKIVEYHPSLAKKVADMWNMSQDGWGGSNQLMTEEQVLKKEETSGNLNLYLALHGDEVVGYCGLSEYREDEGALYIPLLNVRDDYHGKKIGKRLLLKAIEKAIELGWPRLDLYTWAGNTKAVPLYKKCGFFWEERDDSTHLLNFIPTVLQTEAVQDFLTQIDWYEDSTRAIEVKPDGTKENDFEYFQYSWEKDGQTLRMDFERTGRGLRLIETDDYFISVTAEQPKCVFGAKYKVYYDIRNKSGKPLSIQLQGVDDKNISFSFEETVHVEDEMRLEGFFYVNPISEEQNNFRTHPRVQTLLEINGQKAAFNVGIFPQFPAKLALQKPSEQSYIHRPSTLYLEIDNQFNEEITFEIKLPQADFIQLETNHIKVHLKALEKRSLPFSYQLRDFGFYAGEVLITAIKNSGEKVSFSKKIGVPFIGVGARFYGECEEHWHIYNGLYHVRLSKLNNQIKPGKELHNSDYAYTMYPKLGKPYSDEFSKTRPIQVEFKEDGTAVCLKATYESNAHPDLQLINNIKLFGAGLIEQWYEVINQADQQTAYDVWLNHSQFHALDDGIIPYLDRCIDIGDSYAEGYSYWNSKNISENWIYCKGPHEPRAFCWPSEYQVNFSWFVYFDISLGLIPGRESRRTKSFFLSLGAFQSWQEFRAFSLGQAESDPLFLGSHLELQINEGNPITSTDCKITLIDYKLAQVNGEVQLFLDQQSEPIMQSEFPALSASEVGVGNPLVEMNVTPMEPIHLLTMKTKFDSLTIEREALLLKKDTSIIHTTLEKIDGIDVFTVDNGVIQIKSAPQYSHGLFSLAYNKHEYLAHTFPHVKPKSWWNPWVGGIYNSLSELTLRSIFKEQRSADFVRVEDQYGHVWQGFKISVELKEHEQYKGLSFSQYFLLLPGLPVLAHFTNVNQQTHHYIKDKQWVTSSFLNMNQQGLTPRVITCSQNGKEQHYFLGKEEQEIALQNTTLYVGEEQFPPLQISTNQKSTDQAKYVYMNKEVCQLVILNKFEAAHDTQFVTEPLFYLFNEQYIPSHVLDSLRKLQFTEIDGK